MPKRSLALRVTALVALSVLVSSAVGFAFAYVQVVRLLRAQLDATIVAEAADLADEYRAVGLEGLRATMKARAASVGRRGFALRLIGPEAREAVAAGPRFELPRGMKGFAEPPQPDGRQVRVLGTVLPDGAELAVAADLEPLRRTAEEVASALFGAGALTAILAVLAGLLLAWQLESRLGRLSNAARAVMAGDLARRERVRSGRSGSDAARPHGRLQGVARIDPRCDPVRRRACRRVCVPDRDDVPGVAPGGAHR